MNGDPTACVTCDFSRMAHLVATSVGDACTSYVAPTPKPIPCDCGNPDCTEDMPAGETRAANPCINPAHAPDCPGEHHPLEDVFSTVNLRAAERLFGADSNATLGMDPVRYVRHQRDECPSDQPCALCMYELGERMYHQAIDARDEAHRALHRVRQLCDDPEIPHAGSCASYRVFKSADGPYPCNCIVASIRRALP